MRRAFRCAGVGIGSPTDEYAGEFVLSPPAWSSGTGGAAVRRRIAGADSGVALDSLCISTTYIGPGDGAHVVDGAGGASVPVQHEKFASPE